MADKIIKNPSITPNDFGYDESNAISSILGTPLAGSSGTTIVESDFVWLPFVNDAGDISWQRATSAIEPSTANIKGPQGNSGKDGIDGTNGKDGEPGKDGTNGKDGISPTFTVVAIENGTNIKISGAQGEESFNILNGIDGTNGVNGKDGEPGKDGKDGKDGISPTFKIDSSLTSTIVEISGAQGKESFTIDNGKDGINGKDGFSPLFTIKDLDSGVYPQGGKQISIQYGDSGSSTTSFDILNGVNSQAASTNLYGKDGVKIDYNSEASAYDISLSGHCYPDALSSYSAEYVNYARNAIFANNTVSSMDNIKEFIDASDKTLYDMSATLFSSSANWNNVSAKSHTTITTDQVITTENDGSSATISAVQYVYNDAFLTAPMQIFVCKNEEDLTGHLNISQNKGTLFFVCSAV